MNDCSNKNSLKWLPQGGAQRSALPQTSFLQTIQTVLRRMWALISKSNRIADSLKCLSVASIYWRLLIVWWVWVHTANDCSSSTPQSHTQSDTLQVLPGSGRNTHTMGQPSSHLDSSDNQMLTAAHPIPASFLVIFHYGFMRCLIHLKMV